MIPSPFPPSFHRIGVFALSRTPNANFPRGLERMRSWGVEPVCPVFREPAVRYLASTDEERLRCFHELLEDESLSMLMAAGGGFGVTRILDGIDWELLRRRNLPICGYSDVTALLLAAYAHGCGKPIVGPMVASTFGRPDSVDLEYSIRSFCDCLLGRPVAFPAMRRITCLKAGAVTAPLVPCNLTLLRSLLATPHMPELRHVILAVEDISEPAHSIDRTLTQLHSAGILPQLSGMMFGDFSLAEDGEYLPEILQEWAEKIPGPVVSGIPFGHECLSLSFRVGAEFSLDTRVLCGQ